MVNKIIVSAEPLRSRDGEKHAARDAGRSALKNIMKINHRPDFTNALIHLTRKRNGKIPYHNPGRMFYTEGEITEDPSFETLKR